MLRFYEAKHLTELVRPTKQKRYIDPQTNFITAGTAHRTSVEPTLAEPKRVLSPGEGDIVEVNYSRIIHKTETVCEYTTSCH